MTDADAKAYYEANKARFGTTSEADALRQIKAGLGQQRQSERRAAFARELRAKYDVKVLLEPYRVPVEIGARPRAGQPEGAGHGRRVLGLPVPVLRARAAHRQPRARGLRRQGALGLPPLPARLPRPGGEGGRGRGLRRRAGEVLGDARPPVGQPPRSCRSPTSRPTPPRSASTRRPFGQCLDSGRHAGLVEARPRRRARATASRAPPRSSSTGGRSSARSRSTPSRR